MLDYLIEVCVDNFALGDSQTQTIMVEIAKGPVAEAVSNYVIVAAFLVILLLVCKEFAVL